VGVNLAWAQFNSGLQGNVTDPRAPDPQSGGDYARRCDRSCCHHHKPTIPAPTTLVVCRRPAMSFPHRHRISAERRSLRFYRSGGCTEPEDVDRRGYDNRGGYDRSAPTGRIRFRVQTRSTRSNCKICRWRKKLFNLVAVAPALRDTARRR